jgi:hypothetical protein
VCIKLGRLFGMRPLRTESIESEINQNEKDTKNPFSTGKCNEYYILIKQASQKGDGDPWYLTSIWQKTPKNHAKIIYLKNVLCSINLSIDNI